MVPDEKVTDMATTRDSALRLRAPAGPGTVPGSAAGPRPGRLGYLPGYAGAAYLVAWVAGLAVWPSNLALNSPSAQIAASYRAHHGAAAIQYLLVEGLAGVLFGIVIAAAAARIRPGRADRGDRAAGPGAGWISAAVLGAGAVLISLTQCVLGLALTGAATGHQVARAGELYAAVDRLDGVKMLALAGVAACLVIARGRGQLPRWLRVIAALAALALVASGVSYLLLAQGGAGLVYLSGPLLLAWIAGTGGWLAARARSARATQATA